MKYCIHEQFQLVMLVGSHFISLHFFSFQLIQSQSGLCIWIHIYILINHLCLCILHA